MIDFKLLIDLVDKLGVIQAVKGKLLGGTSGVRLAYMNRNLVAER